MIFKHFRYLSAVLAVIAAPVLAGVDDHVLGAFDAYRAGDPMKLAKHAKKVDKDHVLTPWIEYWRISLRLDDAQSKDVREFFAAYPNTYVAERLRGDWLKVLGKRADLSLIHI